MYDFGYLKTPPGLLTILATILNIIAFICVITTEEKTSIHAGFLLAVTILGILASITIVVCHVVLSIARKIPPYPFALAQVHPYTYHTINTERNIQSLQITCLLFVHMFS